MPARTPKMRTRPRRWPSDPDPSRYGRGHRPGGRGSHGVARAGQVPRLRPGPGRRRAGRLADGPAARLQQHDPVLGGREPGRPAAALRRRTSSARTWEPRSRRRPRRMPRRWNSSSSPATPRPRSAPGWPTRASSRTRARSCSSPSTRSCTGELQQGTFVLRKNMTPDQLVHRPAGGARDQVHRHRPAHRPAARADHREAPDPRGPGDGSAGLLRPRQVAAGRRSWPTIRG